jgi:restriction system protein
MDIIFHYPPELFQMLVDTIPLLCRSKTDTLLFFKGAGVEHKYMSDLEHQVNTNRSSIKKHDIVRIVLTRLNERGEVTLRERREILKRVTEFEDFSCGWPDDQLKAKGLVAQIRHVVNVKDSFTKMKQEQQKERQMRQLEQKRKMECLAEKKKTLEEVKRDFYSLFAMVDKQKRGKLLEKALNLLFKAYGILVKESFTLVKIEGQGISEQIDGVIELDGEIYLVEIKWTENEIGVDLLSSHLIRVYHRGYTRAIFISGSGYTKPALSMCQEALQKTVIVLCTIEEIFRLLEQEKDLNIFLKDKIHAAIIDKNPFKIFY